MHWLEAALAFALVMVALSTVVATITEMVLRAMNSRENDLSFMIEQMGRQVIWPRLKQSMSETTLAALEKRFLDDMTRNPVTSFFGTPDSSRSTNTQKKNFLPLFLLKPWEWLMGRFVARQATSMTILEFMERLGTTEVGRAIAAESAGRLDDVVNDLAQKYDRFCAATRDAFAARAHVLAAVIALPLAFLMNVDAIRVIDTLLADSKVRAAVIATEGKFLAEAETAQTKLDNTIAELKKLKESQSNATPTSESASQTAGKLQQEAEAALEVMRDSVKSLSGIGIPIGQSYYPYCRATDGKLAKDQLCAGLDLNACEKWGTKVWIIGPVLSEVTGSLLRNFPGAFCKKQAKDGDQPKSDQASDAPKTADPFAGWFFSTLLAWLLISLGTPFWSDAARGLSRSVHVLRALGLGSKKDEATQAAASGAPSDPAAPSTTPVEAFRRAVVAGTTASTSRPLLAADGTVLGARA